MWFFHWCSLSVGVLTSDSVTAFLTCFLEPKMDTNELNKPIRVSSITQTMENT